MSCADIKKQLTDYIDGSLSNDTETLLKDHISSCSLCRKDLEDLKKTISLVNNLKEVEPPSWYAQKIMSQIKQESTQKGGLDKLKDFFTIGIQIKVLASVFTVLFAIFIYTTIISEPNHLNIQTQNPVADAARPENTRTDKNNTLADSVKTVPQDRLSDNPPFEQKGLETSSNKLKPKAIVMGGSHSNTPGLIAEKSNMTYQQKSRSTPQEEYKQSGDTGIPKDQGLVLTGTTIKESLLGKTKPIELTLSVSDLSASSTEIETILKKMGAKITRYESLVNKEIYNTELAPGRYNALIDKLKTLGDMKSKNTPTGQVEDNLIIKLEITSNK
jgi:hypothetical protein